MKTSQMKVRVFGQTLNVRVDNEKVAAEKADGLFDEKTMSILLGTMDLAPNKEFSKEYVMSVFIHELSHAALDISGVSKGLTEQQEEAICWAIGNGFKDVISSEIKDYVTKL